MANRYDLVTARPGREGKTYWTKIGAAFPSREGDSFSLVFEALPIPALNREGALEVRVMMRVPFERDGDRQAPPRRAAPSTQRQSLVEPIDDDSSIPF
jgi:hypothetical protein